MRIALLCSTQKIIKRIKENKIIFSNSIFLENIINDIGRYYFKINRSVFKKNFEVFKSLLNFKYIDNYVDAHVSFVNIKFKNYINVDNLLIYLKKHNYIIANISSMYLELDKNWVRISIGKYRQMIKLAKLINDFLEEEYE